MSTIYNYTRNPYSTSYVWPAWIIMPDDGDPFYAQSANIFEKTIDDRNCFALEALFKQQNQNFRVKAESTDVFTISLDPFTCQNVYAGGYYITGTTSVTSIGSANLEPAGLLAPTTWYYVYQKITSSTTSQVVIRDDPPDQWLLYRDNGGSPDLAYKFLLSFFTDGAGHIWQFKKEGGVTHFINKRNLLNAGTATTPTAISCTDVMPPHARQGQFSISLTNNGLSSNDVQLTTNVIGLGSTWSFKAPAMATTVTPFRFTVNPTGQTISYNIGTPTIPASTVSLDAIGFYE